MRNFVWYNAITDEICFYTSGQDIWLQVFNKNEAIIYLGVL